KQHLRQTHAIVSFSHAYMHRFLQQVDYPADQAYIIPFPLDIDAYPARKSEPETPTLGFLSRLCPANGFDLLVEAFLRLHEDPRFRDVRLLATGGIMKEDQPFIERLRQRIGEHQLLSMFEIIPDFRLRDRIHFLSAISILCVPVREPITFGSFMLEANAMGVPVLQPNLPPFVEYVEATKGGELFPANDVEALTEKLRELLLDSPRRKALGAHSQEYVRSHFSLQAAGAALVDVYHQIMTQTGY
ncbi:MAG: glycosyltransferase, partial [Lentisphaerae bacterium]